MADDKPKITVIYQEPPKPDGCGQVLLELLTASGLMMVGILIYSWFN